jgi:hypothetical protein
MFKNTSHPLKVALLSILIVPALFVLASYGFRAGGSPELIVSVSNPEAFDCKATGRLADTHQCATWKDAAVDPRGDNPSALLPSVMFMSELAIAVLVYVALKKVDSLLLLSKILLVVGAILLAPFLAVVTNATAFPYGQQFMVSVSKVNGGYAVDNEPALGFGPISLETHILFSLLPAIGLIGGVLGAAAADQRKYAGMKKEKLFQ